MKFNGQDFGYLRLIADGKQLRIEYHSAADGPDAKTPDDSMALELATHTLVR